MEDDDTTELPIDGALDPHTVTDAHPTPPLRGRTYSLRGAGTSSDRFYSALAAATDALVARVPAAVLLGELRRAARHPRRLRRLAARPDDSVVAAALTIARERLGGYLEDVEGFLAELPLRQRFGTTLTTTREQYLLAMLEVELTNRTGIAGFLTAERRIALLPHCAKADEATCKARHHRLDEVCAACTPGCTLDAVSRTLRRHRNVGRSRLRHCPEQRHLELGEGRLVGTSSLGLAELREQPARAVVRDARAAGCGGHGRVVFVETRLHRVRTAGPEDQELVPRGAGGVALAEELVGRREGFPVARVLRPRQVAECVEVGPDLRPHRLLPEHAQLGAPQLYDVPCARGHHLRLDDRAQPREPRPPEGRVGKPPGEAEGLFDHRRAEVHERGQVPARLRRVLRLGPPRQDGEP